MADVALQISGPAGAIVDAVAKVAVALIENDTERRATMSEASKAEQDKILAQAYWDWRGLLEKFGIVGAAKA